MIELVGLLLVIISALFMLILAMVNRGREGRPRLRQIQPVQRMQKAIAQVVESGDRLHVSLGNAGMLESNNASTLAGLSALGCISRLSVMSDHPPFATSGESISALLGKNILHAGFREGNSLDLYDPDQARLTGITPFSYVGGMLPLMHDNEISANMLIGHFGPEIALVTEAAHRDRSFILGASDALQAQSVLFASTPDVLIGEEVFAIPAYLQAGPLHLSSLQTQDVLRWLLIVLMIGGAALKVLGIF